MLARVYYSFTTTMNSIQQNQPKPQYNSGFFCPKIMVQDYVLKTRKYGKPVEIHFNGYILFPTNDVI